MSLLSPPPEMQIPHRQVNLVSRTDVIVGLYLVVHNEIQYVLPINIIVFLKKTTGAKNNFLYRTREWVLK